MRDTSRETPSSPLQLRPVAWAVRLLIGVVILHGAFAAAAFDRLPARLPVHFGASGAPDAYAHPGLGSWFFLPLLSIGLAVLVGFSGIALFHIPPRWINMPQKASFLSLEEGERRAVLGIVSAFTVLLGAAICATLLAVQVSQALVAFGSLARFPVAVPFAGMGVLFALIIAMTVRTSSAINAAVFRRAKKGR
jgi:uncharacterized membrane protein